ncbi:hypothetical protein L615_008400000040 [Nocardioides sp. J9]|uniref:hypothetical protein n=1 Tax=unclassified Nocardioides TaxID=2615069 RepID=UPI0004903B13|nr:MULTISPECIES: hypothetical protein [unclassified Nocardioides]TWG91045.1 hypothetical protein L615_008400000040 [Nocardioides sp. J9]
MRTRTIVLIVLAVLAVPVLLVGAVVGYFVVSGTPFWDEWQCSEGEAPYHFADGGTACAAEGSELPEGAQWDPLGNRPFECHDRWGWTEIERIGAEDEGTDCLKEGRPVPDGWREVR